MGIPTVILWAAWAIGMAISVATFGLFIEGDDTTKMWLGGFAIFCLITIPWYRGGLHVVESYPYTTNIIGIVETTILTTGAKISVVKTDKEIINLSDKFHMLIPDGSTYSKLVKSNTCANGLWYSYDDIDVWSPIR